MIFNDKRPILSFGDMIKAKMPAVTTSIQHCALDSSQINKAGKLKGI